MVFSLKNNFILLYFLKHVKDDIWEMKFLRTVFKSSGKAQGIDQSHVIVETSCESELGQSVVHLLYTNLRFQWIL